MSKYNQTLKVNEVGKNFLDRLGRNRIKADTDLVRLSYGRLMELIYKYFKDNDKNYKDLLNTEYMKNA